LWLVAVVVAQGMEVAVAQVVTELVLVCLLLLAQNIPLPLVLEGQERQIKQLRLMEIQEVTLLLAVLLLLAAGMAME
jgi:hypothetical protein